MRARRLGSVLTALGLSAFATTAVVVLLGSAALADGDGGPSAAKGARAADASASSSPSPAPSSRSSASGASGASGARDGGYDPRNQTALSESMAVCIQGNAKYAAKDYAGAADAYRRAAALAPKNPLPPYLLGEALLASGGTAEGEAAFTQAEALARDGESADPLRGVAMRGRILFVLADVKERAKKWDEARAAWATYAAYTVAHADAGLSTQAPGARTQAIEDALKQDKLYEAVRQRIAAEDAGVSDAPASDGGARK